MMYYFLFILVSAYTKLLSSQPALLGPVLKCKTESEILPLIKVFLKFDLNLGSPHHFQANPSHPLKKKKKKEEERLLRHLEVQPLAFPTAGSCMEGRWGFAVEGCHHGDFSPGRVSPEDACQGEGD